MELSVASWSMNGERYFSGFLRDITERKKIEQLKTDLVSFASHQLKTPVAEVKGLAENMLHGYAGALSSKGEKYLALIQQISARNLELITGLLNISKIEAGTISTNLSKVKLSILVHQLADDYALAAEKKGLLLGLEEIEQDLSVMADPQKTMEALRNVMDNALRFTKTGKISLRTRSESGYGIIEIEDSGPGIDHAVLSKLFTKEMLLSSREGEGSGLGLYIAKSFMRLQHGDVTVESAEGGGSKFTFFLPQVLGE